MRRFVSPAVFALIVAAPLSALADDPQCPPGGWFCEEVEVAPPPETALPDTPDEASGDFATPPPVVRRGARPSTPRGSTTVVIPPPEDGRQPPVVVYQDVPEEPPPQVVIVTQPAPAAAKPVREVPPPPPVSDAKKRPWTRVWGLNLRLEGVAMGRREGAADDAGMGGLGMSFRFRPVPAFAFDAGIDLLGGTDYNGFRRTEVPMTLSGLLYVNPRSAVQFYFMGGLNWSHAKVESNEASPLLAGRDGFHEEYSYFGGHGGVGLEFRVTKLVSLNIDGLGFIRSRTDPGIYPEYVDANTGRSTDTSGGGLFRGGITFWW